MIRHAETVHLEAETDAAGPFFRLVEKRVPETFPASRTTCSVSRDTHTNTTILRMSSSREASQSRTIELLCPELQSGLTVYGNIRECAYAVLTASTMAEVHHATTRALKMTHLEDLQFKRPRDLSPDQSALLRVAMAIVSRPGFLMLGRSEMPRRELKELARTLYAEQGTAMVYPSSRKNSTRMTHETRTGIAELLEA